MKLSKYLTKVMETPSDFWLGYYNYDIMNSDQIDEVDYSSFDSQLKTLRESSESYLINSIQRDV